MWSKRSAISRATTSRPRASPAQNSDRAVVAVAQRRRLEEPDEPVRDADLGRHVVRRSPARAGAAGPEQPTAWPRSGAAADRRRLRSSRGRAAARHRDDREQTRRRGRRRPPADEHACHATPPSTSAPTTSGADSAPRLKNRWSRFIARPRPVRKRSRNRPFAPPSRPPPPSPASSAARRTGRHVGARPKLAIPAPWSIAAATAPSAGRAAR